MSAPEEHALLSASGAHKWLHCTPSARLEETLPESTSDYAEEGRLAHAIAELKLRKHFGEPMGPKKFNAALKKLQEDPRYDPEMLTHTDTYLDYVKVVAMTYSSEPFVAIEKRLDYGDYAPEGFGTGDCIIIGGTTLHVIDLKYGKGVPVSAEFNRQMMLYALGAIRLYLMLFDITDIQLHIVQPRLDNISEWGTSRFDLEAWGESIKPIAATAFAGQGDFTPGEWCRFCRARQLCRARSDFNISLESSKGLRPPLISNEEVGELLKRAQDLAKWAEDLEAYALTACLNGEEVPGWKAVEGRSTRAFTNTDDAFTKLKAAGYDENLLYVRKPISLAETEKLVGKKPFADLLTDFVVKPPGKPTLAPATDKRDPITNRTTAIQDFGQEGESDNE